MGFFFVDNHECFPVKVFNCARQHQVFNVQWTAITSVL